jgi:hypothetical protein
VSLPEIYFLFFKFNQEFVVAIPEDPFIIMKHTSLDVVAGWRNAQRKEFKFCIRGVCIDAARNSDHVSSSTIGRVTQL